MCFDSCAAWQDCQEYKIYIDFLLRPFSLELLRDAVKALGGRPALEHAVGEFIHQLRRLGGGRCHGARHYVPGCDDRKLTRACLRRAKGIELQVLRLEPLVLPLRTAVLSAEVAPDMLSSLALPGHARDLAWIYGHAQLARLSGASRVPLEPWQRPKGDQKASTSRAFISFRALSLPAGGL